MKQQNVFITLGIIVVIAIAITGCFLVNTATKNAEVKEEVTKVRIGNLPVIHGLPLYVALEKGYFKEAGIEVELVKFEAPNQIIDALLQDQIDFGDGSTALGIAGIANFKNPGKILVWGVAGEIDDNAGHNLIIPISSTLTSIKELKGKRLGINAGTIQWRTITREILAQNSLDMDKDVTIVELAPSVQVQAIASNQVDALLALEPQPTIAIAKGVAKLWIKAPAKQMIVDPFYGGAGVVRSKFAQENPETTKKVIQVFEKTIKEINQNPNAYRKYLKGNTPLTGELITKVPLVDFKLCNDLDERDVQSIITFYSLFTKYRVIDGTINIDELLYCKS